MIPMKCRCQRTAHDEQCPKWCDLRPGGATAEVPQDARATTLFPDDYPEQG